MIVPGRDPGVVLGEQLQVGVGPVLALESASFLWAQRSLTCLAVARAVVVELEQRRARNRGSFATPLVLVYVVSQVNDKVMLVLSSRIAVGVEVSNSWSGAEVSRVTRGSFGGVRKLLQEKTAKLISETSSSGRGAVFVRPKGLFLSEPQTLNW